jgi:outer membrane protein assembly factor BamE (lipoprotein component of BamABCDE complex)
MKIRSILSIAAAACAVWLSGCAVTPATRIQADPEAFAKLTPDQQAMVKQGKVGIGFTMDAVRLALGDPTHKTLLSNSAGNSEVWHYTEYQTVDGTALYTGYYHHWGPYFHGFGGGPYAWGGPWGYPYFEDYYARVPRDYLKVTFNTQGFVSEVEQEQRPRD